MTATGRIVAVIGAECSGKTTLARALAAALPGEYVPEQLRLFVQEHRRPPLQSEQAGVMRRQIAAAALPGTVISDGGALMTAVYSVLYFDDDSLVAPAVQYHRKECALTVWCGIDVPWQADQGQRDGPQHRRRADAIIAGIATEYGLPVRHVCGSVAQRLAAVLAVA